MRSIRLCALALALTAAIGLTVGGCEKNRDEMRPAIRIYDVEERRVVGRFAGPDVSPAMPWPPGSARAGWIAFGEWLFAISPEKGTGVWDVCTGEEVAFEAGFAPRRFHPERREFLSWDEGGTVVSRVVG